MPGSIFREIKSNKMSDISERRFLYIPACNWHLSRDAVYGKDQHKSCSLGKAYFDPAQISVNKSWGSFFSTWGTRSFIDNVIGHIVVGRGSQQKVWPVAKVGLSNGCSSSICTVRFQRTFQHTSLCTFQPHKSQHFLHTPPLTYLCIWASQSHYLRSKTCSS